MARRIIQEVPKTEEELFEHYIVLLSDYYHLPFFDERWDNYTLDNAALEWFLIEEKRKPKDVQTSEILSTEYKDDLAGLADEMEQWSMPKVLPMDKRDVDTMNKFMESGKFPGEK
jgi:hypothetical protein